MVKSMIALLALGEAGYMALDGIRALIVGDYITPGSGRFAGQLGPWSAVVSAIGIAPRIPICFVRSVDPGLGRVMEL